MATTSTIPPTPFPRLGEIYRNLALSLGTKRDSNELDRLAREGEYDWRIPDALMDKLFIEPINALTQRTEQKSKKTLANRFSALTLGFLTAVQDAYLQLVTSMELTATDRNSALPLLIEALFGPAAGFGLKKFKEELGGPDLAKLLDESSNPMEEAFLWFENATKINIKELFPESHGSDRSQMELIRRWRVGDSLPDYDSIDKTVNEIFNRIQGQDNKQLEELCNKFAFWLLIGRSISWFNESAKTKPCKIIKYSLENQNYGLEALRHLVKCNDENFLTTINNTKNEYSTLKKGLYGTPTQPRNKENLLITLEEFERKLEMHDKIGGFRFYATRFRARWHALNGEISAALPLYEKSLSEASYRGGIRQKEIIHEALTAAAYLCKHKDSSPSQEKRINIRPAIKRIKNQAIAVGLIPSPVTQNVLENWEIEEFLQGFYEVFPKDMFFKDALPVEEVSQNLPVLATVYDESEKPDLSKPNKQLTVHYLDGQSRRMSQLHHFVVKGDTDAVRELLKHGASPDILDQTGGSCILCAIQDAQFFDRREMLDILLQYPHKKETINNTTPIKRFNALHVSLELCDPRVVRRLLEMGADPNVQAQIENITPLYRWAGLVMAHVNPQHYFGVIESKRQDGNDIYRETKRRSARPYADPFGNTPVVDKLKEKYPDNFKFSREWARNSETKNLNLQNLLEIGEILLKAGAKPNAQEFPKGIPKSGRTPLMLLAEGGNAEAFDLLVHHGGDPEKRDAMGKNCLEIAIGFGNKAVVDYLTGKQAV